MSPLLLLLAPAALATSGFDPSAPAARFEGAETYTVDGAIQLWSAIERLEDPDRTLLVQEDFNASLAWPAASAFAPFIADCFGDPEPGSHAALLHIGPGFARSAGTPVLFVPGAGDNGSRGFVTMATRMDREGRPVFALTFAHPHGDVFRHAELLADAIARVKVLTGAEQVDLVSHSKGGISTAVYLSHTPGQDWGNTAYETVGTPYRGDVRRAVFIAVPLGGVDTSYRWPSGNYASLVEDAALAPTSWDAYYPSGSAAWWIETDLGAQDFLPGGPTDLFPGQRQMLARWDDVYPLPGSLPWLVGYNLQQDWYTTYEGGFGYVSHSDGIDAAIEAGGDLLARLEGIGADPEVELFLMAGENPMMPNGVEDYLAMMFGEALVDLSTMGADLWADLMADLIGNGFASLGLSEAELQGLIQGKLLLGEISGPSDGLVFVDSALYADALTARGAPVLAAETRNLSHLDLLYASPITGQLLKDAAAADPVEDGWRDGVGDRYIEADTLGWLVEVLADPDDGGDEGGDGADGGGDGADGGDGGGDGADGGDGGDGGADGADGGGDDGGEPDAEDPADGGGGAKEGGCASAPVGPGLPALAALLLGLGRARRRRG